MPDNFQYISSFLKIPLKRLFKGYEHYKLLIQKESTLWFMM